MQLRAYQAAALADIQNAYRSGRRAPLLCAPTGSGKCFAAGTPILLFDGQIKAVEDIGVGDLLMGPDGRPREVIRLARGREEMFRVTPTRGVAYVVNRSHTLSLAMTGGSHHSCGIDDGTIVNLTVNEYLSRSRTFKHCAKGWRAAVDFAETGEMLRVDPYFLGMWLGDGSAAGLGITTADAEIAGFVETYATRLGLSVRKETKAGDNNSATYHITTGARGRGPYHRNNPLRVAFAEYGLVNNKHIPHAYKVAPKEARFAVLAGILDTDGHWSGFGYELTQINERLIDDVLFVARSLGFSAYKASCVKTCGNNGASGTYWRCNINGPVHLIPCLLSRKQAPMRRQIKNPLLTGISAESIGEGEYFGFEIAGPDRLFLLGDFTVVHNSAMTAHMLGRTQKQTLYLCHRAELLESICDDLDKYRVPHGVISAGRDALPHTYHIHVGMMQTVGKRLDRLPSFEWVISDEAHLAMAPTWLSILKHYDKAWHLGMSATPCRLDGKGLGEFYDQIIYGPTVRELTDRGYLSACRVFAPSHEVSAIKKSGSDFNMSDAAALLDKAAITGSAMQYYRSHANGRRAIVFCCTREHADHVAAQFRSEGIGAINVDGSMSPGDRRQRIADFRAGRVPVLTNVELLTTGFDCPEIEVGIFLRPTQSLALYLQMVGRILRIHPGKTDALMLDHVGNVLRHGMPDQVREWTLDGRAARAPTIPVRQCPKCYAAFAPAPKCPACTYVFPVEAKSRVAKGKAGELVELTDVDAVAKRAAIKGALSKAVTLEDFHSVAHDAGYKPGWAFMQYKLRARYRGKRAA